MSNGFGPRVQLCLRSSLSIAAALTAGHALAAAAVLATPMPVVLRLSTGAVLAVSLLRGIGVHAMRSAPGAVTAVAIDAQGALQLRRRHGEWRAARLVQATVLRRLVVLRLAGDGVPRGVVVAWDGVDLDAFRRFRAALRSRNWEAPESYPRRRARARDSRG